MKYFQVELTMSNMKGCQFNEHEPKMKVSKQTSQNRPVCGVLQQNECLSKIRCQTDIGQMTDVVCKDPDVCSTIEFGMNPLHTASRVVLGHTRTSCSAELSSLCELLTVSAVRSAVELGTLETVLLVRSLSLSP